MPEPDTLLTLLPVRPALGAVAKLAVVIPVTLLANVTVKLTEVALVGLVVLARTMEVTVVGVVNVCTFP